MRIISISYTTVTPEHACLQDELKHEQAISGDTEKKRQFQNRIDTLLISIDSQLKPLVQVRRKKGLRIFFSQKK